MPHPHLAWPQFLHLYALGHGFSVFLLPPAQTWNCSSEAGAPDPSTLDDLAEPDFMLYDLMGLTGDTAQEHPYTVRMCHESWGGTKDDVVRGCGAARYRRRRSRAARRSHAGLRCRTTPASRKGGEQGAR